MNPAEKISDIGNTISEKLENAPEVCKEKFENLSGSGKKLIENLYERVRETPVKELIVGKLEIAFDQLLIKRYDEKYNRSKDKLKELNKESRGIKEVYKKTHVKDVKGGIKELAEEKKTLRYKMLEIIEQREKYKDRRKEIADKVINYYKQEAKPAKEALRDLKAERKEIEEVLAKVQRSSVRVNLRIERLETQADKLKKIVRYRGISTDGIDALDDKLYELRLQKYDFAKRVKDGERELAKKERQIEKASAKVDPYRLKIKEFKRIREGKELTRKPDMYQRSQILDSLTIQPGERFSSRGSREFLSSLQIKPGESFEKKIQVKKAKVERRALVKQPNGELEKVLRHFNLTKYKFRKLTDREKLGFYSMYHKETTPANDTDLEELSRLDKDTDKKKTVSDYDIYQ